MLRRTCQGSVPPRGTVTKLDVAYFTDHSAERNSSLTSSGDGSTVDIVTMTFGDLIDQAEWVPMELNQQHMPSYFWNDGGLLADAPVDFAETFRDGMFVSAEPVDMMRFGRNPLRVRPNFTVPRHHHNVDELLIVLKGEYSIEYDVDEPGGETKTVVVRPGDLFISRAGTAYTMTAGPEGVSYIETWPGSVTELKTYWHDSGWVRR